MDKKKIGKSVIKIMLIIIIILLLIMVMYVFAIYFDGFLDKSKPMTKEEVISLLEKGKEYPNYYYSPRDKGFMIITQENMTEYYIKDNIVKCVYNGETLRWENANTDEVITVMGYHEKQNKNFASISKVSEYYKQGTNSYSQQGFDYSLIVDNEHFNYNFKYLGEKEIEGRNYILVKVWDKETFEMLSTKFLIDKETGLIAERTDYMFDGIFLKKITCDRNLKIDSVTEEDVKRPDLTGYEILQ